MNFEKWMGTLSFIIGVFTIVCYFIVDSFEPDKLSEIKLVVAIQTMMLGMMIFYHADIMESLNEPKPT